MLSLPKFARISFFSVIALITVFLATINYVRLFEWPQIHVVYSFDNEQAVVLQIEKYEKNIRIGDILLAIDGNKIDNRLSILREL